MPSEEICPGCGEAVDPDGEYTVQEAEGDYTNATRYYHAGCFYDDEYPLDG